MGGVLSKEAGHPGPRFLSEFDIETIAIMRRELATMGTPPYGSAAWYTKVVGLFIGDTNDDQRRFVDGINAGDTAKWARDAATDARRSRDAELVALTSLEDNRYLTHADIDGIVYLVQTNGPCSSCRTVIKNAFMHHYNQVDVVIWYRSHINSGGSLYGIGNAVQFDGGYVMRWFANV
jgi:hypothetical protein